MTPAENSAGHADLLVRFRSIGDPLADAAAADLAQLPKAQADRLVRRALDCGISAEPDAPESWKALFAQVDDVPPWVNWEVLNRASQVFLNAGILGMLSLSCHVTPLFYRLSVGNKALAFSGDLHRRAPRRGRETARFVIETCIPGNLRRDADGFKVTLRVRLIHAHVRRAIALSGRWDEAAFGTPISQVYMASMNALLSMGWIGGLRQLGFRLSRDEEDSIMQLWRYSAWLIGVDRELQFGSLEQAQRFWRAVVAAEPSPDDDARQFVRSIIAAVPKVLGLSGVAERRMTDLCLGLTSTMLGAELSRQLQLPRTLWRHAARAARLVVPLVRFLDARIPAVHHRLQYYGTSLWLNVAEFPPEGGLQMFAPRDEPFRPARDMEAPPSTG